MKRFSRRVGHGPQQLKRPGAFRWPPLRWLHKGWLPRSWLEQSGLRRDGGRLSGERPVEGDGGSQAPPQASPLLWALLAAVVLHGLALSFRSVRLQRRPQPAAPSMADDSPELLQFSRRQPLEEALQTVPIAPLNSLPLMGNLTPPPASLPPNPAMSARFGTIRSGTASSVSRPRPAIAAGGRRIAASGQQQAVSGGRDSLSAPAPGVSVADSALARIHRLQGRGEAGEPRPASDLEPSSPPPQRPEGEAAAAWRRLWKRAMVVPASAIPPSLVSEAIELRRLPLSAAALDTVSRDEPTALLLDGRLLLLWPEGSLLWLFWAPLRSVPVGGAQ